MFSNEFALRIMWPKDWNFSFNISPSNEHPGLISFRMDWLDLLAVQETLKSLLQHTTVQKHQFFGTSAFFIVQLSHPYMTTGKTKALTRWTFVGKHASTEDSWTLTAKSGSVSCGVTAPFSWFLVCTRFCLCPPRVCFPSPV